MCRPHKFQGRIVKWAARFRLQSDVVKVVKRLSERQSCFIQQAVKKKIKDFSESL